MKMDSKEKIANRLENVLEWLRQPESAQSMSREQIANYLESNIKHIRYSE